MKVAYSGTCKLCGCYVPLLADYLGICPDCARQDASLPLAYSVHAASRRLFSLPTEPPHDLEGVRCGLCGRECVIGEGERGYCGLRAVEGGKLQHLGGVSKKGILHWYRDPLPTNCVADWVCAGSRQRGKHNLAVFYASCTLNCLYCQNWNFREVDPASSVGTSSDELVACANPLTYCVCYFGGDPASQMPHALASAHKLAKEGVIVCWETAGTAHPRLLKRAVEISLDTGGCIKFDLKAYSEALHIALTGSSNGQTFENFALAASYSSQRLDPPLVIASTLLVPGYVDTDEIRQIAEFIARHDRKIPYALLGFGPNFLFPDLPATSVRHAEEAREAALGVGLENVRLGNRHLLGRDY